MKYLRDYAEEIRPIERGDVEAFIINNQNKLFVLMKPGVQGYVSYLEDEKDL